MPSIFHLLSRSAAILGIQWACPSLRSDFLEIIAEALFNTRLELRYYCRQAMIGRIVTAGLVSLLLLCAAIGMMVVAFLWLVWYVSVQQRPRERPLEDNENGKPSKQQGLSEADLHRLPTIECRKEGGEEGIDQGCGNAECAVCLEAFQGGEQCRVIPVCSHAFHVECADAWLSKRSICPICRRSARENENEEEKGVIVNVNVNGDAAGVLQEEERRDEESGRSRPPAPAESTVVIDMSIA